MVALEKRFFGLSFVLPFLLYQALVLSVIDSEYKTDILDKPESLGVFPSETQTSRGLDHPLRLLLKKYEEVEKERNLILRDLNDILSNSAYEMNSGNEFSPTSDLEVLISQQFPGDVNKFVSGIPLAQTDFFEKKNHEQPGYHIIRPHYAFNCSNIHEIKLVKKIGHGVSKQAFLGKHRNNSVAIKMVTRHQKDFRTCLDDLRTRAISENIEARRSQCFIHPTMKLMKEILLLEQLQHPGILELLGYCARSEESDSTDIKEHGVLAVYELGERVILDKLEKLSSKDKIRTSIHLAELLKYLQFSPLGSLRVKDFKEAHFLQVGGVLKMIDLDDVDNVEPSCNLYTETSPRSSVTRSRSCASGIQCQMGLCIGDNARQNLKSMNKLFFKVLLQPTSFPVHLRPSISVVRERLDATAITAQELIKFLHETLDHLDAL